MNENLCKVITQSGKFCDRVIGCEGYCNTHSYKPPKTTPEKKIDYVSKMDYVITPESDEKLTSTDYQYVTILPNYQFFRVKSQSFFNSLAYLLNHDEYMKLNDKNTWALNFKKVLVSLISTQDIEKTQYSRIIILILQQDILKTFPIIHEHIKIALDEGLENVSILRKYLPNIGDNAPMIKDYIDEITNVFLEEYKKDIDTVYYVINLEDVNVFSIVLSTNILIIDKGVVLNKHTYDNSLKTVLLNSVYEPIVQLEDGNQILVHSVGADVIKKLIALK